jgi:hypothetical protein
MTDKKLFYGVLVLMLTFGLLMAGCDNLAGDEESDTWSNITNLNQMNGTWKSTYSQDMSIKEAMEQQGMDWTSEMQTTFGNMKGTSQADITLTINASAKTRAMSITSTAIYSGGNIGTAWPLLKQGLETLGEQYGVTVNNIDDANHSATVTYSQPAQLLSDKEITEILDSGLQVNQNATKLTVPGNSVLTVLANSGGSEMPELIFIKQ